MSSNRDPQAVQFVKPDIFYSSGLAVGEDHCLPDNVALGLLKLAKDRGCPNFHSWHGFKLSAVKKQSLFELISLRGVYSDPVLLELLPFTGDQAFS